MKNLFFPLNSIEWIGMNETKEKHSFGFDFSSIFFSHFVCGWVGPWARIGKQNRIIQLFINVKTLFNTQNVLFEKRDVPDHFNEIPFALPLIASTFGLGFGSFSTNECNCFLWFLWISPQFLFIIFLFFSFFKYKYSFFLFFFIDRPTDRPNSLDTTWSVYHCKYNANRWRTMRCVYKFASDFSSSSSSSIQKMLNTFSSFVRMEFFPGDAKEFRCCYLGFCSMVFFSPGAGVISASINI